MTHETTSIIETEQAQNSQQATLPEAETPTAIQSNSMPQPVQTPVVQLPISKQEKRYQLSSKFATARCAIESLASAAVNAACGAHYKGTFDIHLDNPNEVTGKTLAALCGAGSIFFKPDELDQYPVLKKVRQADDGINLSALMTKAKRPSSIDDNSWQELNEMWNNVSKMFLRQGLAPMHMLIARVLTEKGVGGPRISKKLRSTIDVDANDKHEVLCQILDNLNELLAEIRPTKVNVIASIDQ
jgi:hypothetical protein